MASFVHQDDLQTRSGVVRAENAIQKLRSKFAGLEQPRATASLLLAGTVAALVVTANQMIESWTDGHLMAAWLVLWTIAFAASALLASPLRRGVAQVAERIGAWRVRQREIAADQKLWRLALTDARIMAEISRAMASDATGRDTSNA